jgi:hypothetical protein
LENNNYIAPNTGDGLMDGRGISRDGTGFRNLKPNGLLPFWAFVYQGSGVALHTMVVLIIRLGFILLPTFFTCAVVNKKKTFSTCAKARVSVTLIDSIM